MDASRNFESPSAFEEGSVNDGGTFDWIDEVNRIMSVGAVRLADDPSSYTDDFIRFTTEIRSVRPTQMLGE